MAKERYWYLAGPMSGIPQFNFPLFEAAAEQLRVSGYNIISPAELDDVVTRSAALRSLDGLTETGTVNHQTWGDFLSRDVKIIADKTKGIIFLPGWEKSRGARLEAHVAVLCGHIFRRYTAMNGNLWPTSLPLSTKSVIRILFDATN